MTINSHLMLWSVYPETSEEQHRQQAIDFYGMGEIPVVRGQLLARKLEHRVGLGPPGRKKSNPYRPRELSNFVHVRPAYDYFFAIEFPDPAPESEDTYNPHRAHLDFAWRNCQTIWSEYLHQDFLTETVETGRPLPETRVLHFDFWSLWQDADPEQIEKMYAYLSHMPEKAPDLLRIRYGRRDPLRPRGATQIGVREEIGLRNTVPWHFRPAGGQFDGYFQMEFDDIEGYFRYLESPARIDFANAFCGPLWSEFHTQRFKRLPKPE